MSRPDWQLAVVVGITSSVVTACLFTGVGNVSAKASGPTLESLNARLHQLESKPNNRVRAPFVVVDAQDQPIVTISASGANHLLTMGTLGSGTALQLERSAEHAMLVAQSGSSDTQARLGVRQGRGPRLEVYTKENSTIVGNGTAGRHGIFVRDGGGGPGKPPAKSLGELAVTVGSSGAVLRLSDKEGKPVLSAGSNAAEGGRGQLGLSAPGKPTGLFLFTGVDGGGEMQVMGGDGKPAVELSGVMRHVLLSNRAGQPAAVMRLGQGGSGSGGNFTVVDPAGNNVVSAGALSGGGGALCAIHPKKGNKCFP
ncbi:hypothetical protein [Arenimonas sp. MALMAid1274]|uniref:hypothetical protein n=1 Tax=Arenimonas sp. MALMAid1274 TaxID=3411630 RepID=UPI003B9FA927